VTGPEMMNERCGRDHKDPSADAQARGFSTVQIDGHSPLLSSYDLQCLHRCGVRNCHETYVGRRAREKRAKGMRILIREGTGDQGPRRPGACSRPSAAAGPGVCSRRPKTRRTSAEEGTIDYVFAPPSAAACGRSTLEQHMVAPPFRVFDRRGFGGARPAEDDDIRAREDLHGQGPFRDPADGAPVPRPLRTRPDVALAGIDSVKWGRVRLDTFHVPAARRNHAR